jgi:hypothetical protein
MYKGAEVDVSTAIDASIKVRLGRTVTAALTNPVGFKIEVSGKAAGDQFWLPVYVWVNAITAACAIDQATNLLNGATSAGATTYTLDLTTGQNAGDLVFFNESTKYEWSRTKSVSGAVATPLDSLTFAHADNTIVTDQGEEWDVPLGLYLPTAKRIRLIVDCAAAGGNTAAAVGQTVVVEAEYNILTSYTTV